MKWTEDVLTKIYFILSVKKHEDTWLYQFRYKYLNNWYISTATHRLVTRLSFIFLQSISVVIEDKMVSTLMYLIVQNTTFVKTEEPSITFVQKIYTTIHGNRYVTGSPKLTVLFHRENSPEKSVSIFQFLLIKQSSAIGYLLYSI